jgi:Zn-dependent protease
MTDILALIAAIFLLIQLQRLRAVLAYPFAPPRARRITAPNLPAAFADLYFQAGDEAAALGFEGPHWYLFESQEPGAFAAMPLAAWRKPDSGDVLWLLPPQAAHAPNRLTSWLVRRLADGRHCVSQPFDCYAEIAADAQILGQTLRGDTLAAQWQQHDAWSSKQGSADPQGCDDASLDWQAAPLHQARIESLLRRGKLYRDSRGRAVARLAFAWQLLGALRRQPRPVSNQPVPPARLAWLAGIQKRVQERPAPRRAQAGLFAFSVLLFLVAGGWFWGLQFAAILFVVVGIHELGHYLAMRAFGYRNVQMLALPLVGGVTMGYEAKPHAARRAWMSLMGPLPGILIGWALVAWFVADPVGAHPLLLQAALVFLFLNYLNVLPVPPLDGAQVVQELLPVGAPRLAAVFIVVACLIGGALAVWAGFYLLAVLAALQLPQAFTRWRLAEVLGRLRKDPEMDKSHPLTVRQRRVFEVFDQVFGPTPQAVQRLGQAGEVLRSLDVQPMRRLQRVATGAVYVLLLAGPVLAGIFALRVWQAGDSARDLLREVQAEQARDGAR